MGLNIINGEIQVGLNFLWSVYFEASYLEVGNNKRLELEILNIKSITCWSWEYPLFICYPSNQKLRLEMKFNHILHERRHNSLKYWDKFFYSICRQIRLCTILYLNKSVILPKSGVASTIHVLESF